MKVRIFITVLSLLLLVFACDPSYRMEMPNLSEDTYNNLSFEEKFEVYKKVSGYIDTPDYVDQGIAKEGEKAVPLILEFIESSSGVKTIDAIYLLSHIHKNYFDLKGTEAEEFLKRKIKNEELSVKKDKYILESYKNVLESIQAERTKQVTTIMLTPGYENIPAFYNGNEDIINYVALIKEEIMQETGMTQKEVDERFAIIGYAKGEEKTGYGIPPVNNKTIIITFVAKIDWVEVKDHLEFTFLDDQGNKLSLEKINQQIKIPFYFNITQLRPKSEIEKIITTTDPRLKLFISPPDNKYIIQTNEVNKEILLTVFSKINEEKNQCLAGTINAVNGDILVNNVPCVV